MAGLFEALLVALVVLTTSVEGYRPGGPNSIATAMGANPMGVAVSGLAQSDQSAAQALLKGDGIPLEAMAALPKNPVGAARAMNKGLATNNAMANAEITMRAATGTQGLQDAVNPAAAMSAQMSMYPRAMTNVFNPFQRSMAGYNGGMTRNLRTFGAMGGPPLSLNYGTNALHGMHPGSRVNGMPSLSLPHNMKPATRGLSAGTFFLNQGRILQGTGRVNAPSLRMVLTKSGGVTGQVEGIYGGGRSPVTGSWQSLGNGKFRLVFVRTYKSQRITYSGKIKKGTNVFTGKFTRDNGRSSGGFQYMVNMIHFPGKPLPGAPSDTLEGQTLQGVLVAGSYSMRGEQENLQTKLSKESAKYRIRLKKSGIVTGSAIYKGSRKGVNSVVRLSGNWNPTGITFVENHPNGVKYTFRGMMKHGMNTLVGIYTSSSHSTGTFKYDVNPRQLESKFDGVKLRAGRYKFSGTTTNWLTGAENDDAKITLTMYEDGKLSGFAEYTAANVGSNANSVRLISGAWNPYSLYYRETHNQKNFIFVGAMVKNALVGSYAYAVSSNAPILRGKFKYGGRYLGPVLDKFQPRGILAEGEYIVSGTTTNLRTKHSKNSPTIKLELKKGGKLVGTSQGRRGSSTVQGKWTPSFVRYTDGAYTYRAAMALGENKLEGTYGPTRGLRKRINQGRLEYAVRPINVKRIMRSGYIQAGDWKMAGEMTGVYSGKTAKGPQFRLTFRRDGSIRGFTEYPPRHGTAPWLRQVKGWWSPNTIKLKETDGLRKFKYKGVLVGDNNVFGHYSRYDRHGRKFLDGNFKYKMTYVGPGLARHGGEPQDILVEGQYVLVGKTRAVGTRGAGSGDKMMVKVVLSGGGSVSGYAQYSKALTSRPITGSWTPGNIDWVESGSRLRFKGAMRIGGTNELRGTYIGGPNGAGTFDFKVRTLSVDPSSFGPKALLVAGEYTLKGDYRNLDTKKESRSPTFKVTLEDGGKVSGIAEYLKTPGAVERVARTVEGEWDERKLVFKEAIPNRMGGVTTYTFKGVMSDTTHLTGSYFVSGKPGYPQSHQQGSFKLKVSSNGPPLPIIPGAMPFGAPPSTLGQLVRKTGAGGGNPMSLTGTRSGQVDNSPFDSLGLPNLDLVQTLESNPGLTLTPGLYRALRGEEKNDATQRVKSDPDYMFQLKPDGTLMGRLKDRKTGVSLPVHGKWTQQGLEFDRSSRTKVGVAYNYVGGIKGKPGRLMGVFKIKSPGAVNEGASAGYFVFHLRKVRVVGMGPGNAASRITNPMGMHMQNPMMPVMAPGMNPIMMMGMRNPALIRGNLLNANPLAGLMINQGQLAGNLMNPALGGANNLMMPGMNMGMGVNQMNPAGIPPMRR